MDRIAATESMQLAKFSRAARTFKELMLRASQGKRAHADIPSVSIVWVDWMDF